MPTPSNPQPPQKLKIAVAQIDIVWETPQANLRRMREEVTKASQQKAHLLVFPEVMTTGFSTQIREIAEEMPSQSLAQLSAMAREFDIAIVSSIMVHEEGKYYNRAFMLTPEGKMHFQDKRHLFGLAGEAEVVTAAQSRHIFEYRGWKFFLICCYDLRFPVWNRNVGCQYDVALVVANWPKARATAWKSLLQARAIENLCYLSASNRTGVDPQGVSYQGDSAIYSFKGDILASCPENEETILYAEFDYDKLKSFQSKFPVWQDADAFTIDS